MTISKDFLLFKSQSPLPTLQRNILTCFWNTEIECWVGITRWASWVRKWLLCKILVWSVQTVISLFAFADKNFILLATEQKAVFGGASNRTFRVRRPNIGASPMVTATDLAEGYRRVNVGLSLPLVSPLIVLLSQMSLRKEGKWKSIDFKLSFALPLQSK